MGVAPLAISDIGREVRGSGLRNPRPDTLDAFRSDDAHVPRVRRFSG